MIQYQPKYLIGIAGKAGVGKSTVAHAFSSKYDFKVLSFGYPVKKAMAAATGLPIEFFIDPVLKEKEILGLNGITPRILMQKFATEFMREMIYSDFWLWRMRKSISDFSDKNIIIDDVRFENEASLIRDNGGVIIHLEREFESLTKETDHVSEKGIIYHRNDIVIYNKYTVEETATEIFNLV